MKKNKKLEEEMAFEIRFYEGILRHAPDFIEALMALGDLYTKRGLYEQGLKVDEKLSALRPDDPCILYNLACSYSLVNNIPLSLRTIKCAIRQGYEYLDYLEQDPDLNNLRQDRRFQTYISRLKKKMVAQPS